MRMSQGSLLEALRQSVVELKFVGAQNLDGALLEECFVRMILLCLIVLLVK